MLNIGQRGACHFSHQFDIPQRLLLGRIRCEAVLALNFWLSIFTHMTVYRNLRGNSSESLEVALDVLDDWCSSQLLEQDVLDYDDGPVWLIRMLIPNLPVDRNIFTGGTLDHRTIQDSNVPKSVPYCINSKTMRDTKRGRLSCPKLSTARPSPAPLEVFAVHREKVMEVGAIHPSAIVGDLYPSVPRVHCNLDFWLYTSVNILETINHILPNRCFLILEHGCCTKDITPDVRSDFEICGY